MPYPSNLHTAQEVESVIRFHKATPATIAIISGKVHIGLSPSDLETIAQAGTSCVKCSRRNLPYVTSKKLHGSTTVAGTMYLAHMAGLKIFVTGGIGGVHRGAEETWDVSADLIELGRTQITVICAGAKSILDINKTLEYLETQGVPVIGYNCDKFPAFFSKSSGCEVMCRLNSAKECASFIRHGEKLGLNNGNLIAVPLADEELAKNAENAIQVALEEMKELGVKGSKVTPFLLKRVNELSEGESLKANIALIKQNAMVGAMIACEYYKNDVVTIIGGVLHDIHCFSTGEALAEGESAGKIFAKPGGVGFNLLKSCVESGVKSNLISVIGNDHTGGYLLSEIAKLCEHTQGIFQRSGKTNQFLAFIARNGEVEKAIVDRTDIEFTEKELVFIESQIKSSKLIVVDANLTTSTLHFIGNLCQFHSVPLFVEPTADWNCHKLLESGILQSTSLISPNLNELNALLAPETGSIDLQITRFMEKYPNITLVMKNGKDGVWLCEKENKELFEIEPGDVKNVCGAGDLLVGCIAAGIINGTQIRESIREGMKKVKNVLSLT